MGASATQPTGDNRSALAIAIPEWFGVSFVGVFVFDSFVLQGTGESDVTQVQGFVRLND